MSRIMSVVLATVVAFSIGGFAGFKFYELNTPAAQANLTFPESYQLDSIFNDDFFSHSKDPFQEMERLEKELDSIFHDKSTRGNFDAWFKDSWGHISAGNIRLREVDDSVFYELTVGDQTLENVDVIVENGYVEITADLSKRSENKLSQTRVKQTLPVPAGADPTSLVVENRGEKIFIQFSKQDALG